MRKKKVPLNRNRKVLTDNLDLRRRLGNALAPFGVASIFVRRRRPQIIVKDRLRERKLERPAQPLRLNNWIDPFRSVCADRKERRSVLFATNKVGKGKSIHTPKTFSIRSSIKCD